MRTRHAEGTKRKPIWLGHRLRGEKWKNQK